MFRVIPEQKQLLFHIILDALELLKQLRELQT